MRSRHELKLLDSESDERDAEAQQNALRGAHEGLLVSQQRERGAHESHGDGHLLAPADPGADIRHLGTRLGS